MSRLACPLLVALALAATGCVTAQAKGEPGGPALAPPAPPPHTVIPVEIVEAPPAPAVPPSPAPVILRPSSRPPEAKSGKLAEKPAEKPPDPATAPPQPVAPPPASPLQTTTNVVGAEANIRKRMKQASSDLEHIDPRSLNNTERRTQFDAAKRFLEQAEDALKVKNLVFAEQLADKAATLAAALVQK